MNDTLIATCELVLPSELGYEKHARQLIAGLFPRLGFPNERIADIQTAVSEACINAIEHGNQGQPDRSIQVRLSVAGSYIDVVVIDEGVCVYHADGCAPASIEQKLAGLAPARGMGLMLIQRLVDEASFLPPRPGYGNRFRLRVYRPTECPAQKRDVEGREQRIVRERTIQQRPIHLQACPVTAKTPLTIMV